MRIIAFDLEATGPDPATARIVSYAAVPLIPAGPAGAAVTGLVSPGVPIPEEATAVHGITSEQAAAEGQAPAAALAALREALTGGGLVCAFNARYDLTVLHHELSRYFMPTAWLQSLQVADPLVIDRAVDKYRAGKRTLTAVAAHYGVTLDNAHEAEADAVAAGQVFYAVLKKYRASLPASSAGLHNAQVHWAREQAASLQAHLRRTGQPDAIIDGRWPIAPASEASA